MINEEELKIANKSYINKDFPTIYAELLDSIKLMTNRWDPQTSNESDPGIVLTKLNAFIADKNNYNIDKNVLENFMLSATQEGSMRKLCDMMGYYMNYYIAPEVEVTLMYTGDKIEKSPSEGGPLTLNALETTFGSSEDESINFILTETAQLLKKNVAITKPAIQGELKTLMGTAGDTDTQSSYIQLENLDDNHRIYFPESNVAQNGVFINTDDNKTFWRMTKNLNYEQAGEKVFKFGYDSTRGLPYVEFPDDIAILIDSGLHIRYVVTSGLLGNIKANILNTLLLPSESGNYSFSTEEDDSQYLFIRNFSGSINGADPESIDDAYNNFKRTVGTFDTLVTCRDYANAIYDMLDVDGVYPLVSNVQVADRRDDINYCTHVVTYDGYGPHVINIQDDDITPYDLCCYPLAPLHSYTEQEFLKSFTPTDLSAYIQDELENSKSISHNYKEFNDNDIYLFKNYLTLNANLSTTYKVNDSERLDIIANVEKELIKNFNARKVDYGYEIPYETLLQVISNADKRISSVGLAEPYLTTKVMLKNGNEVLLKSNAGANAYLNLISKNVLNGNVPLFEYDNDFKFEFGQKSLGANGPVAYDVKTLETDAGITLANATNYTLNPNEFIQLVAPNLVTKTTYPVNVLYYFDSSTHGYDSPVSNDNNYKLAIGETLYIMYTDTNDNDHTIVYGHDSTGTYIQKDSDTKEYKEFFIQPSKLVSSKGINGLYSTNDFTDSASSYSVTGRSGVMKMINGESHLVYALSSSEAINYREFTRVNLTSAMFCYWLRNNKDNKLFASASEVSTREILLEEGEYFFYTDSSKTSFVSLGSGTTIEFPSTISTSITCNVVDLDEIIDKGILAIDDWKRFAFTSATPCTITENQILTLGANDKIKITGLASSITLTNVLQSLGNVTDIEYTLNDEDPQHLEITSNVEWRIKSRLDIDVSKGDYQVLYANQTIKVFCKNDTVTPTLTMAASASTTTLNCFNLNTPSHLLGGIIDVTTKDSLGNLLYPVKVYYYAITSNNDIIHLPTRDMFGYFRISSDDLSTSSSDTTFKFDLPKINNSVSGNNSAIFMVYVDRVSNSGELYIEAPATPFNGDKHDNVTVNSLTNTITIDGSCMQVLAISGTDFGSTPTINIYKDSNFEGSVTISSYDVVNASDPTSVSGMNNLLGISEMLQYDASISTKLLNSLKGNGFYYNYKPENTKLIDLDSNATPVIDMLSPYVLYDFNNVANKFTLSEIDFESSRIDVVRGSRL